MGRFKTSTEDENKLELDCNAEGVVFDEASMDITAKELFTSSMMPNWSWKKIECKVESHLPLAIQVRPCVSSYSL
ncbi:HXXXD-type acyl-transferase family protein, putative [Medicago truncatula]|uniref:HXXXD-type acyl-transferase family protein, putative n=1 Tax=Medicago truncatula TaxID=3880 RepID=A0A072VID6_MEDTR|nr:HXXXD-type acyl-transferase family protein, putative [Medicago truncatula]